MFEDNGQVRRGYFVDGLGGAQFASTATIDELRRHALDDRRTPPAIVLAATDPANPFGAALGWPTTRAEDGRHRPGRKPGAMVVMVGGELVVYVERGGKTLLTFTESLPALQTAAGALAEIVRSGRVARLMIDQVDSEPVLTSDFGRILIEAGFATTPRGVRMRYGRHA